MLKSLLDDTLLTRHCATAKGKSKKVPFTSYPTIISCLLSKLIKLARKNTFWLHLFVSWPTELL